MMGLRETEFVCVDVETTGCDFEVDRIIEVAAWRMLGSGERVGDPLVSKICPGRPIPPEASAIHHITDEDVEDAPPPGEVLSLLLDYMGERAWVAHNAMFDARFLGSEVVRQGLLRQRTPAICTLRLARHLLPDAPGHALQVLKYYLKLSRTPPHAALGDVQVTCELFGHLVGIYLEQGEEDSVRALHDFARKVIPYETMPRGKHRGLRIAEIPTDYLAWVDGEGAFSGDTDLRSTLLDELKRRRGSQSGEAAFDA